MGALGSKVVQPVCSSCSQRKVGALLFSQPKGAPGGDAAAEGLSPRSIARATAVPGAAQGLTIAKPEEWSQFRDAFFAVQVSDIPKATGAFQVLQGDPPEPTLSAVVLQADQGPCRLYLCPPFQAEPFADEADNVQAVARAALASCAPAKGREPCTELEVRGRDGAPWGAVVSKADGSYSLFRDKRQLALTLREDRKSGRILAHAQNEVVAVVRLSAESDVLEIGVKPNVDPILVLAFVLGIATFDLDRAVLPMPVL
mmetsp:Transcript_76347/g.227535  ORF Transcript_76347/g.227535 Transcript_76347/m.227535 type:complete len:257 (+) Transcript_76347:82-852(+)